MGGNNADFAELDSCERYCMERDTWSMFEPSLPERLNSLTAISLSQRYIYIIGGGGDATQDLFTTIYRLDTHIRKQSWDSLTLSDQHSDG